MFAVKAKIYGVIYTQSGSIKHLVIDQRQKVRNPEYLPEKKLKQKEL